MKEEVIYQGMTFVPYITRDEIQNRIQEIGKEITEQYAGKNPLLICVLNGSFPFAADLFRQIDTDAEITFIRLKSYEGTESTGKIKEIIGLQENIEGRPVIVVEDIVDTGNTIAKLIKDLETRKPSDIKVASLLFKPESLQQGKAPDYIGFSIPSKFIIGFGLDIDGMARNLNDIYVLKEQR